MKMSVNQGIEDELRVLLIVAHLCLIGQSLAFLRQSEADGINEDTVVVQAVYVGVTVDAGLRRCRQVNVKVLEVDISRTLQQFANQIVLTTVGM